MKLTTLSSTVLTGLLLTTGVSASDYSNVGVGIGYGLFSGPSLALSYPITETLQIRGSLSGGMGLSDTAEETDIKYDVKADGGIHRLALDYHPFYNGFFLSAGYAVNQFELTANGQNTNSTVTIGNDTFNNADLQLTGQLDWDNAPTLSLGWGHSPNEGLGFMIEIGAFFTGAASANLTGTGSYDNGNGRVDVSDDPDFQQAIKDEETKLKEDVADLEILPMLQLGLTYRF